MGKPSFYPHQVPSLSSSVRSLGISKPTIQTPAQTLIHPARHAQAQLSTSNPEASPTIAVSTPALTRTRDRYPGRSSPTLNVSSPSPSAGRPIPGSGLVYVPEDASVDSHPFCSADVERPV